jgi:hypothetical protein
LYNLCRVFKPIAIVCVNWLWTVLRSVILARYTFLVLLLSPECVSPAEAVEMWGYEQVGPTSQMRDGSWIVVVIWCFGVVSLSGVRTPEVWTSEA